MPGGVVPRSMSLTGTADLARIEAPVTVKAYLICAFAAFGGIFFGYDTGWMSVRAGHSLEQFVKNLMDCAGRSWHEVLHPAIHRLGVS